MKKIFSKYKERLINLSSRNRSLVMKKLYKKRAFDLSKLLEEEKDSGKDILDFVLNRHKKKFLLVDDPYEKRIERMHIIEKAIAKERKEEISNLNKKDIDLPELNEKKELIIKKYNEKLSAEIEKLEKEIAQLIDYSTSLMYLYREINATEKETGRYELFIGYSFTEGKFQDHTFVKAPLLLFPVKIQKENNKWYMYNILDQDILINKVFIYGFAKYNETKVSNFDTEFTNLNDFDGDKVKSLLKYLYNNKITIQDTKEREIEKFIEHTTKNMPNYKPGELVLKNYFILGQFPISNSIYNDYQMLEKTDSNNKLLHKLLINDGGVREAAVDKDEEVSGLSFSEEDTFFLTSLDYSQENAVKEVNETDQLVIYGPPGTGKSQTIANIIADSLAKNKKVLMVSQKRAALDVIFNRLGELNSKVILIHDANKDKKGFYQKVAETIESIESNGKNSYGNYTDERNISIKAKRIDKGIRTLEQIAKTLHRPRGFGLTLQQMYSKSKNINSKEDDRYKQFKLFRDNNKLYDYTYQQIKEAVSVVDNSFIIDNYFKNSEMLNRNCMFRNLKSNFDFLEAQEVHDEIKPITHATKQVFEMIKNDEQGSLLLNVYKSKKYSIDDSDLRKLVEQINHDKNEYLLQPLNDGKWWSLSYWLNFNENKKKEKENKQEYELRRNNLKKEMIQLDTTIKEAINKLKVLKLVLTDVGYNKILEDFFEAHNLEQKLLSIVEAIERYEEYRETSYKIDTLSELEKNTLEYAYNNSHDKKELVEVLNNILEFVILSVIWKIEKQLKENQTIFDYSRFNELTNDIRNLMSEKNELTPSMILYKWDNEFEKSINSSFFKEFKRQANKKRALWPIRKYISQFDNLVFNAFPCWLLSPETVSDMLPLKEGMFDVIIFDEASQMFIENAIPTIFRGKSVVVAGDDKQLRPSSTFKSKFDDIDAEELEIETAAALEEESLLDLAKVNYKSVHLNYHYRSKYDELINFSNYAFYRGRLQVSPNIESTNPTQSPIERIVVEGQWIGRQNIKEAERIVKLIEDIFKKRKNNETIGIITFNITQKDLIEDLLEKKASEDPEFKVMYAVEIDRKDGNEDVSLFVKNIENVQGDERDIIIFSVGYAKNENGRVSVNFGALSQDGGENRLNVAVSRARRKIYVVTSIEPEELNVESTKNLGPKLFKKYLQYVKEVSCGNLENANIILNSLIDSKLEQNSHITYDSDFEMEVYDALTKIGYDIKTQVGVSGYKIDLAIYDKGTSKFVLGIECDGAAYHSSKSARERDIHRQRYLESRGWRIIRIWSRDWWRNPNAEVRKIDSVAKMYLSTDKKENRGITPELKLVTNENSESISGFRHKQKPNRKSTNNRKVKVDENSIRYGDKVVLRDIASQETFEVELEANQYNRQLMKDIELNLLGHNINEKFNYLGFVYEVTRAGNETYKNFS